MKKIGLVILALFWSSISLALSGQAYLDRFNNYRNWYQNLPTSPSLEFLEFIKAEAPLSKKLREKWLYELARNKDWTTYLTYYLPTSDLNLLCYKQRALYQSGQQEEALETSTGLWLTANSLPVPCTQLFDILLKMNNFNQDLITQRLIFALNQRNIPLAFYLLKQYKISRTKDIQSLRTSIKIRPIS